MKIRVRKWGNSLGVRIPKIFAMQMGIDLNNDVDLSLQKDGLLISRSCDSSLEEMLQQITSENVHAETEIIPHGREVW